MKDVAAAIVFLQENNIKTVDELETKVSDLTSRMYGITDSMKAREKRIKLLTEAIRQTHYYKENLPVFQEMAKSKYRFKKARAEYEEKHHGELVLFYAARRKLKEAGMPDHYDPAVAKAWKAELAQLQAENAADYEKLKPIREEQKNVCHIQYCVNRVLKDQQQQEQKKANMER